uniref:Paired domain-containing protein n=1 Tax=Anopheles atroparvus TaxID=41427 RepID=A0AAG5DIR0_ANOAO
MPRRKVISLEEKKKIVKLYNDQYRVKDIGKIMSLSSQTVSRIVRHYLKHWEVIDNTKKRGGEHRKKLNENQLEKLKEWVEEDCTISLKKISDRCEREFGVKLSVSTVHSYLTNFRKDKKSNDNAAEV